MFVCVVGEYEMWWVFVVGGDDVVWGVFVVDDVGVVYVGGMV